MAWYMKKKLPYIIATARLKRHRTFRRQVTLQWHSL